MAAERNSLLAAPHGFRDSVRPVDVAPLSIPKEKWAAFEQAVRKEKRVTTFFKPPQDPGFHLEIPQRPA